MKEWYANAVFLQKEFLLKIIGNFNYNLEGVDLEVIQWNKKTEINDLHSFDIGIYPLIEDQWALGKGALKAMQYMAIGIPTVATNYGTNPQVIEQEINGFLVNSKEEWVDKLEYCLENNITSPIQDIDKVLKPILHKINIIIKT